MDRLAGTLAPVKYDAITYEYSDDDRVVISKYWTRRLDDSLVFIHQVRQEYDSAGRTTLIERQFGETSAN